MSKTIVISAVNLVEGGTLTVLRDCLAAAESVLNPAWRLVALVNNRDLVTVARTELIEVPAAKKSWFLRIWYEWFQFSKLSRGLKADLWLSLHDITPRVEARQQAVYCHNPAPFYRASWRESRLDFSFFLFNKLYRYLYGAFIKRNRWVIVQQDWLRDAFTGMYGRLPIIVAHPHAAAHVAGRAQPRTPGTQKIFLFPSFPRVHKNFETLCEATRVLNTLGVQNFEVQITVSGDENAYARDLKARYGKVANLKFIGLQNRQQMAQRYQDADVVVFPGKLETWGLPITEAKGHGKDLLVADRPYAHETVGTYTRVSFFEATNHNALAAEMAAIVASTWTPQGAEASVPAAPFAAGWDELWRLLAAGIEQPMTKACPK